MSRALWVCVDCLMADANGETLDDMTAERAAELWQNIPERAAVSMGLLWDEHADDCPNRAAGEWVHECECEQDSFSWHPCDACGSRLGGYRHAYTYH